MDIKKVLKFKRIPRIITGLLFMILSMAGIILFYGRSYREIRFKYILDIAPYFYVHVSNLIFSFFLILFIGFVSLMYGAKMKLVLAICLFLILFNFFYEMYIPILNTPDLYDASFGFLGSLLAVFLLIVINKYGMIKNWF